MPTEQVSSPPQGALPANPEFVNSWMRSNPSPAGQAPQTKDGHKEKESKHHRHGSEYDSLQKARDRDSKDRRSSYNASTAPVPFPGAAASTGYPQTQAPQAMYGNPYAPYGEVNAYNPYGAPGGYPDLTQQFGNMDINKPKESKDKGRERKNSERSRKKSTHEPPRAQTTDAYALPPGSVYPMGTNIYGSNAGQAYPPYQVTASHSTNPSPNAYTRDLSYGSNQPPVGYGVPYAASAGARPRANSSIGRSTTPAGPPGHGAGDIYPPGHIAEGYKGPYGPPKSRATTPNPQPAPMAYPQAQPPGHIRPASRVAGKSPHPPNAVSLPGPQLAAPDAFSRSINASLAYHPFKPIKVQDMDDFFTQMSKLSPQLESHDVRNEDWFRFIEDLTLAWSGRLPAAMRPDGTAAKPAVVAAELIQTWNTSFFEARGVEMVLYRGHQRRSGKLYGRVDLGSDDDSESSSSSSPDSDSDDPYPPPRPGQAPFGANNDLAAARRRYYEEKQQTKQRREARRKRNRLRRRNKKYVVYATCIREGGPPRATMATPAPAPPASIMNMHPVASSYPGMYPMGGPMAPPTMIPPGKQQSHGRIPSVGGKY
ncbi:hypothetical protein FA15DRAFT_666736 [Coprinopsis marcescibilis]|uniref:Uncharacterized protein n=1 Tax=Coprinopsis marcescibilis TaxID=230819 RepID=A0A5C3L4D4_COPMA|nr:hypothetical protein FA15DRAFT_666736 [Coprinopsis marcescibilis]